MRDSLDFKSNLALDQEAPRLIGTTPIMRRLFGLICKIAQENRATVLIQGETGTGKDLVARAIHKMSPRRNDPFIVVNCGSIPEGLMESEFFGHEKGAFTGAFSAKPGRFELAHRGTLFLDEVAEMNLHMQGKLLRALETWEFERVGGTRTQRVDVRVVAASNKSLHEQVRAGRFRQDLFYRLNVVSMTLPPLRRRKDDIPVLVEHFLQKFQSEGKRPAQLTADAIQLLLHYDYPGNVRELENLLERTLILCDRQVITARELHLYAFDHSLADSDWSVEASLADSDWSVEASATGSLREVSSLAKEKVERALILETLRETQWNRVRAAKALGIDYKTLRRKIRLYRLLPGGDSTP